MARTRNPKGTGSYRQLSDGRYAWRQTIDGQTRELSARTKKELQEKIKAITDMPISKEKYTVAEWFDRWLSVYIKPLTKPATYEQYESMWRNHIAPVIGKRKMNTIKTYDIQKVIAVMNEKDLATKTMKHALNSMRLSFKKAEKEKVIGKTPVEDITIPIKTAAPRVTLSPTDLSKLMDALENSRWIWSVKFLLVTGLRRGEMLALKWSDIEWQNKRIVVNKSKGVHGLGDTKSSDVHYVPLTAKVIEYLDGQKNMLQQEFNPCFYNEELKKDPLIFPCERGDYIRPDSYYTLMRRFGKKVGVKVYPHAFRHTFVFFTRSDLSLKDLQNLLGHNESTTTLDIYGDMLTDVSKNIEVLDDVFAKVTLEMEKAKEETKKEGKVIQFPKAK